jgi:hypothetical protein
VAQDVGPEFKPSTRKKIKKLSPTFVVIFYLQSELKSIKEILYELAITQSINKQPYGIEI